MWTKYCNYFIPFTIWLLDMDPTGIANGVSLPRNLQRHYMI